METPPNLQEVLANLARFAEQEGIPRPPPADQNLPDSLANTGSDPRRKHPGAQDAVVNRSGTNTPLATSSKSIVDPATITTWQEGLRCVTKIAAQSKRFEESIRRMIRDQRAHEMRWYSERQALKKALATRSASAARALTILQSLNNNGSGYTGTPQSESDKQSELAKFDQKIHAAQQAMETGMTAELKGLGVPFFGTRPDLILVGEGESPSKGFLDNHPKYSQPITAQELLALKRRMVTHLEDLYCN